MTQVSVICGKVIHFSVSDCVCDSSVVVFELSVTVVMFLLQSGIPFGYLSQTAVIILLLVCFVDCSFTCLILVSCVYEHVDIFITALHNFSTHATLSSFFLFAIKKCRPI